MAKGIPGLPVGIITAGGLLVWSGIFNQSLTNTLGSLLKGKAPSAGPQAVTTVALQNDINTGTAIPGISVGIPVGVAAPSSPSGNQALGQRMAATYGWTGTEWDYLRTGWQEESGWSATAANVPSDPYNHAYGIPQANPGSKMASAGSDWKTNPSTQILWGLNYIRSTYGKPSQVPGWSPNGPLPGYVGY